MASSNWQNWSGHVRATPAAIFRPSDHAALSARLGESRGRVRIVGSGHSFTPLAATDHTLVSLSGIEGTVLSCDPSAATARLQAGASLNALSRDLQELGLAFRNLGDIDAQSLAGATSTGTHGTGSDFPCLSAEMQQITLVTATGETVTASEENGADLLHAARIALGSLGIIVEAEVSLQPAYRLHRRTFARPLKDTLATAMDSWAQHRNFEFFCLPFCDHAFNIVHDTTDEPDSGAKDNSDSNAVKQLKLLRDLLGWASPLRRAVLNKVARSQKPEDIIGPSWAMLANERNNPFNEMEYHLPVDQGLEALEEVLSVIERERRDVFFPVECRMTRGDDAWLSPFQGGPRISVAVHAWHLDRFDWFFEHIEPIFRRRGGRPHWGKMHSLQADDLRQLYPDFERFTKLRRELDPAGRFLNPYLADLWGEPFET
ncbi:MULTISPECIES: D-arabinono-1,4-lactone oxidase [unclassified Minwuia]|jgi:FAD-linked oxidoreductase|uniref:D-arabinono-1,4-lactone oxidase n=1 Tax=unclassified Minwuia TaxID=2618799 RepID=UPI00247AA476|nr:MULTISPECIES: D-arabinono-1,4-lactone oxidase [unclassified Minwuia]